MAAPVCKTGCLRREYWKKLENAPLSENKGDFQFYGHRLSSLYRQTRLWEHRLTNHYAHSNFSKYSNSTVITGAIA